MALSFKDFILIADAMKEVQLEEGKIDDLLAYVKKLLGPKASKEEIDAKVKKLQDADKKDVDKIKKTSASRDFHARKAADAMKPKTRGTVATVSHHPDIEDAKKRMSSMATSKMRAGQLRNSERTWMGEETLEEAQDFVVTYKLKTGDVAKRWKVTARDATQAKRKWSDSHLGAKLVSVEPMKGGAKVPVKKVPEKPSVEEDLDTLED